MTALDLRRSVRRGLRARILLLTMAGTLGPIAILGWLSWSSVRALEKQVLEERRQLAISVAAHVDSVVNSQLALLEGISPAPAARGPGITSAALREAYVRSRFLMRDFVLDRSGELLGAEPTITRFPGSLRNLSVVREALAKGVPEISSLSVEPDGAHRLFLLAPLHNAQDEVVGILGGEIDPRETGFRGLLNFVPLEAGETTDLVDQHGVVIASTEPERVYTESDHRDFLAALINQRHSAAGTCHSCHQSGKVERRVEEVMAFAPLPSRPSWGISIRQREAQAFSTTAALRWKILVFGPALAFLSVLFAVGAASSITAPLSTLAGTAKRIASGELHTPIPDLGGDEVGQLGGALERMRVALQHSRDGLEQRVQERTAQIERLYQELKQRDLLRAKLLEKLIGAQEEERRRIARELHDETSQVIGALAMTLDAAITTLPEGASRDHLKEARTHALRTLDGVHRLSFDLRPSVLDDLGLFGAIEWYAERDLRPHGIAVRCESEEESGRLPSEVETALFRAAQEAVTNIVKHARAEAVLIQCARTPQAVTIEIEDDGEGFDPAGISDTATSGRGLGLASIRERVEILGGRALIESAPGRGTRIVLTVPLKGQNG
jgi:signal transduction histidine kinase